MKYIAFTIIAALFVYIIGIMWQVGNDAHEATHPEGDDDEPIGIG